MARKFPPAFKRDVVTVARRSDGGPDDAVALRRRLRLLEQENEVLRRAAAYLSRDVLPR